jgi:hypothetical protein
MRNLKKNRMPIIWKCRALLREGYVLEVARLIEAEIRKIRLTVGTNDDVDVSELMQRAGVDDDGNTFMHLAIIHLHKALENGPQKGSNSWYNVLCIYGKTAMTIQNNNGDTPMHLLAMKLRDGCGATCFDYYYTKLYMKLTRHCWDYAGSAMHMSNVNGKTPLYYLFESTIFKWKLPSHEWYEGGRHPTVLLRHCPTGKQIDMGLGAENGQELKRIIDYLGWSSYDYSLHHTWDSEYGEVESKEMVLHRPACKIQAAFRGYRVRKEYRFDPKNRLGNYIAMREFKQASTTSA